MTVGGLDGALEHLCQSTARIIPIAIVTDRCTAVAERYLNEVDSATVYWNASTRFTDGAEFGFGAEIGISTDKLSRPRPDGAGGTDLLQVRHSRHRVRCGRDPHYGTIA